MIDSSLQRRLSENWARVQEEIRDAALQAGRTPEDVVTIGVSKYVDAEVTAGLVAAGCEQLAESRPQQLWKKADSLALGDQVRWHLIGHLQRNKIRRLLTHQVVIQSVDSQRLLSAISDEASSAGQTVDVLLEVNISGDEAKTGLDVTEVRELIAEIADCPPEGVRVRGLMAMAGWGTDPAAAREQFAQTRMLRDQLTAQWDLALPELSMGMSGDFPAAIAEGATMVRIGSRLFEGIL